MSDKLLKKLDFKINDLVIYPPHGVGTFTAVEAQEIAGEKFDLLVLKFPRNKIQDEIIVRIPFNRLEISGLRIPVSEADIAGVRKTLRSKVRVGRGMWSKRAKEYETKINSGNIILLSEVVRDLHKNVEDPDRSYSERVIYEKALLRLTEEIAIVEDRPSEDVEKEILDIISIHNKKAEDAKEAKPILDDLDDFEEFGEFEEDEEEDEDEEAA